MPYFVKVGQNPAGSILTIVVYPDDDVLSILRLQHLASPIGKDRFPTFKHAMREAERIGRYATTSCNCDVLIVGTKDGEAVKLSSMQMAA